MLGLLNSELLEFYHKVEASTFIYAGRYRYWRSYLQDYPIIDCCLGKSELEEIWLELESRISDVCDLEIQNGILVCGGIALPTSSGTCSTSLFHFALQKAIVSQVEKILSSEANRLNRLETRSKRLGISSLPD